MIFFFHQSYKTKLPKSKTTPARKCTRSSSPPMIRCRVQYYVISIIFLIPPCPFSKLFWLCGYSHSHVNFGLSFPIRKPAGFCSELLSICKSIWEEFTCCCRVSPWTLFNSPLIYIFFNFSQLGLIIARDSVRVTVHSVCVCVCWQLLVSWLGVVILWEYKSCTNRKSFLCITQCLVAASRSSLQVGAAGADGAL